LVDEEAEDAVSSSACLGRLELLPVGGFTEAQDVATINGARYKMPRVPLFKLAPLFSRNKFQRELSDTPSL
jgi:hypothetical protein